MGLLAALFHAAAEPPPPTTALGGLYQHVTARRMPGQTFVPTNINFGLLPPPDERVKRKDRRAWLAARAERDFEIWRRKIGGAAEAAPICVNVSRPISAVPA
jgi:methylenetetrahydrofolate--tRNA-(uracil-5-)-methyltransferase